MEIKTDDHPWRTAFLIILKILPTLINAGQQSRMALHEKYLPRNALWVYSGQWRVSFITVNSIVQNKLIN